MHRMASKPRLGSGPEVGARVRVYWPFEQQWFDGVVDRMSELHGCWYFHVQYDDSDLQWHAVDETWVYSRRSQRNDAKRQRADSIFACQTVAIKRTKAASTLKRGQRVQVYWEEERKWFVGTVRDFEESTRFHLVVYDDGDQRHEDFEDPTLEWSVVDLAHSANSQSSMEGRDQAVMMHESSGMPAESRATAPIREQSKVDPSYLCGSSQPLWRFKAEPKKLTHEGAGHQPALCLSPELAEAEGQVSEPDVVHEVEAAPEKEGPAKGYSLRHSTVRQTAPTFSKGDLVYVPFDDGNRHLSTVTDCIECGKTAMGRPLFVYSVATHDGETASGVREDEMKAALASGLQDVEQPVEVRHPTPEQRDMLRPCCSLPAASIARELMVDGAAHCGGDLCFPNLTLAHPSLGTQMPVFMMAPGAVASFQGASLCHCTLEHHTKRSDGCAAHVSFAVQTPALTLGVPTQLSKRLAVEAELQADAALDSLNEYWRDAVWLPVWHFRKAPSPTTRLFYDKCLMHALPWRRIVLYDAEKAERVPLVFYAIDGGLDDECAAFARSHFHFLHDEWDFLLDRHHSETNRSGCLHVDVKGNQRMEMLGIRSRQRNMSNPPEKCREKRGRQHLIANAQGDLDAYVVHFDYPRLFCASGLTKLWNGISRRMHALLPSVSQQMIEMLRKARVRERLYSVAAIDAVSDDLLVNNVGVSAAYQSPPHFDVTDVGWTFAFSCKCGLCHSTS